MNILFVHQNYPAQYKRILNWLEGSGEHRIVFLTQKKGLAQPAGRHIVEYAPGHAPPTDAYPYSAEFEKGCANGAKVVDVCCNLEGRGFKPDIVIGHTGWGELLFIKALRPDVPILGYFEYFYTANGEGAAGFDPEFQVSDAMPFIMSARNAVNHLSHEACDLGQTATQWQKNGYPQSFHQKIEVMHEGVRTDICRPNPSAPVRLGRVEQPVSREDEVFTYMARNMEPVRGFHIFMRALPKILDARPKACALIIGGDEVSYGRRLADGHAYRAMLEREVGERIDWSRVHFLGRTPYDIFIAVMQIARCHIYLTAPFAPPWSLLEAMSAGAPVAASGVAPVREVTAGGEVAVLTDFLDPDGLAGRAVDVIANPARYGEIGAAARRRMIDHDDFNTVIAPRNVGLINQPAPRRLRLAT